MLVAFIPTHNRSQYSVHSRGRVNCDKHDDDDADDDGKTHDCAFTKPWFQTLVMKFAMSLCLFITWGAQWLKKRGEKKSTAAGGAGSLNSALLDDDVVKASTASELDPNRPPDTYAIMFIAIPALTNFGVSFFVVNTSRGCSSLYRYLWHS